MISELVHEQEWPERIYPIYANGPGYILSKDIVHFIVGEHEGGTLRVRFPHLCLILILCSTYYYSLFFLAFTFPGCLSAFHFYLK